MANASRAVFRDMQSLKRKYVNEIAETISFREVIEAPETRHYVDSLVKSMTGRYGNRIDAQLVYNVFDQQNVGYTNNDHIVVNAGSDMITSFRSLSDRVMAVHGVLYHEIAHCLYLDFAAFHAADEAVSAGEFYGGFPDPSNEEEKQSVEELKAVLQDQRFREFFQMILHDFLNILTDCHDEHALNAAYGGFVEQCVLKVRDQLWYNAKPFEVLKEEVEKGESDLLNMVLDQLLCMSRFGATPVLNEADAAQDPLYQKFSALKPMLKKAETAPESKDLIPVANKLIVVLWPYLKEAMLNMILKQMMQQAMGQGSPQEGDGQSSNQQNGQSGSQQGGQSGSQQDGQSGSQQGGQSGTQQGGQSGSQQGGQSGTQQGGQSGTQQSGQSGSQQGGQSGSQQGGQSGSQQGGQSGSQQGGQSGSQQGGQSGTQQGGQSGSQQDSQSMSVEELANRLSNLTDQQLNDLAQQIANQMKQCSTTAPTRDRAGKGSLSEQSKAKSSKSGTSGEKQGDTQSGSSSHISEQKANDLSNEIVKDLIRRVAARMAMSEVESAMTDDLIFIAQNASLNSTHRGRPYAIVRDLNNQSPMLYERIAKEQKTLLGSMVRQMEKAFKDMSVGSNKRHQVAGKKFRACDAHRLDGLCFQTKRARDNNPDVAVTILVDKSGSMSSRARLEAAQEAAILVSDFCRKTNIPCMVCGHSIRQMGMTFEIYSDFRVLKEDPYRIAGGLSSVGGCNRDGMAIQMANALLEKRPEPVKLLMIISDGQPNDGNYHGEAAYEDIRDIVAHSARKGIHTIAFAIGDDKEQIKKIYGEGFIDISDLSTLPKKLAGIVRRYVIQAAR